ncbi:MAG: GMP/IMP nucleotidase [Proteobacteria bacterium]|nr:GMP/IMP nucleotidase [Pseudomonadota bacterium]
MKPDIEWNSINTVLLDMDGTLLDLYFDNFFWQEYLPEQWGKLNGMDVEDAKLQLKEWYKKEAGTLSWYCLDFWTNRLQFDVFKLKADVEHLITVRPYALNFLEMLSAMPCTIIMVTNAHQKLVEMKMDKTGIDIYFDRIISAHSLGSAKEEQLFWSKLMQEEPFNPEQTLLIDDNLTVLRAARKYGIKHLLTITRPDSRSESQDSKEFASIDSFDDLISARLLANP